MNGESDQSLQAPNEVDRKDALSGLVLVVVACAYLGDVFFVSKLPIGTARAMGPGYFPMLIAAGIGILGAAIALRSLAATKVLPTRWVGLRGGLVLLGPLFFAFGVERLGFLPATALAVFTTTWASAQMNLRSSIAITACLTAFAVAIFYYLLEIPVDLVGFG